MILDRSPIRETGSSDTNRPAPGDVVDMSRRRALEALLAKSDALEQVPAHRFWDKQKRHTISGRQVMAQSEHAARVWERLFPGKPMHFEVDGDAMCSGDLSHIEKRLFNHYAPWHLRLKFTLRRTLRMVLPLFGVLVLAANAHAQTRQERAAEILRKLDTPANWNLHPQSTCTDCNGPRVVVIGSTPGAATWMTFPPERPRLRLDGTPVTQRPTIYGLSSHIRRVR